MTTPLNHIILIVAIWFALALQGAMDGESLRGITIGSITPVAIAFLFTEVVLWVLYFSLEVTL